MRRKWIIWPAFSAGLLLAGIVWQTSLSGAQDPDNGGKAKLADSPLPIRQVVLFNSGVGYFQREGDVSGNAHVDLSFPTTDINDLLKSLVLQDLGGLTVAAGRLVGITADHIEISDSEVIDAADDVAQLRLIRDLPGGEMRDDFIARLDREFGVFERSSQAELRRTGDGNLRARRDDV